MDPIISSSLVVIIFGFALAVWGFIHGTRTGKLIGYVVLIIGVSLVFLGAWSIKAKHEIDHKLVVEHLVP